MTTHPPLLFFSGLLLALTQCGAMAATADFTGGNGTTATDQYTGIAGDGWLTPWERKTSSGSTTTVSVIGTTPFSAGAGNYLNIDYRKLTAVTSRAGVIRQFSTDRAAGGVDLVTAPYQMSFDFRVESLTGWSSSGDQFAFSPESTSTLGAFGADAPWTLWYRADQGWVVSQMTGAGLKNLLFSNAGMDVALTINMVYSIKVEVDPLSNKYELTITAGSNTYKASDLNGGQWLELRSAPSNTTNYLHFRVTADGAADAALFSLDNIKVVPEPGSYALLLSAAMVLAKLKSKSRR